MRTFLWATTLLAWLIPAKAAQTADTLKELFAHPTREYTDAPLWVWNDQITDEEVIGALNDLASQNVRQAFVHPRPGLMTPYLSPEWFRLWKLALTQAHRLDMNIWIYDENSYPSGFAGGLVPDAMPDSPALGLRITASQTWPEPSPDLIGVYRVADGRIERLTAPFQGTPEYVVCSLHKASAQAWMGGKYYVDLLKPGVTEKFLSITHEAYAREIGNEFGKRVPGVFTDEPNISQGGGLPWTVDLPARFAKRWGYDLLDTLPSLTRRVGDWKRVRHDYYQFLSEQFIEHWSRPYHDWCQEHGLEFTGHYWEHDWPITTNVPDNMAMYAWHQRPAIDILMNQYSEGPHAQFGNTRAVVELASVANQLGRRRTLCEAYGAGGWDLRFEDMKRIGDWMYALGVNTMDEHLSYISIRGARKHDHPQSFSYHEPWWNDYRVMADYRARMTAALCQGEQVNHILLIEPTTTAFMYNDGGESPELKQLGESFQQLVLDLQLAQIEFDIGCEQIIHDHGSVAGDEFIVGQRRYQTVVVPPMTETLRSSTLERLGAFIKNGGRVLCCGEPPARLDGRVSEALSNLARSNGWTAIDRAALLQRLDAGSPQTTRIIRNDGDKGLLFHHRRQLDDGELLLLVNTSITEESIGRITSRAHGIEQWDPMTGKTTPNRFEKTGEGVEARFSLPPAGSLLLRLTARELPSAPAIAGRIENIDSMTPMAVSPLGLNVLTLDFVDVRAGGEDRKNLYVIRAARWIFEKHGLNTNPWDRAVQFKDELIRRTFAAGSGFEVSYHFTIDGPVPSRLWFVAERPELYTVTCNNQSIQTPRGEWWLDKSFGRMDITAAARTGENVVTLKASPMTMLHEIDQAYVLGDFSLRPVKQGFIIAPSTPLQPGGWRSQGMPFYAEGMAYTQRFAIYQASGRYQVRLPHWLGSVARVRVNGQAAGHILCAPWICDVTPLIRSGENEIQIAIIGTLKNTLGPFHGKPVLGAAWPQAWDIAPESGPPAGNEYAQVEYGLWEPFALEHIGP